MKASTEDKTKTTQARQQTDRNPTNRSQARLSCWRGCYSCVSSEARGESMKTCILLSTRRICNPQGTNKFKGPGQLIIYDIYLAADRTRCQPTPTAMLVPYMRNEVSTERFNRPSPPGRNTCPLYDNPKRSTPGPLLDSTTTLLHILQVDQYPLLDSHARGGMNLRIVGLRSKADSSDPYERFNRDRNRNATILRRL